MSFFTGGGATLSFGDTRDPSSFPQFGNRWRGGQIVEEGRVGQQTDMTTKEVIIRNGKPAEQLMLPLLCDGSGPAAQAGMRTDERNPNDHSDLGRRTLYIKGSLRYCIGDALRAVQAEDLDVGGYLYVMWTGMGKTGNSTYIGRTWQVHYIKPTGVFLNSVSHGAPGFQNTAPPAVGAMPMHNGAPLHTGFQPTQQPVTAPPPQGWNAATPSTAVNVAPPNPYGQQAAQPQWQQSEAPPSVQQHYAPTQQPGGAFPPPPVPDQHHVPAPEQHAPGSTPWGAAPEAAQPPQAPYGPSQGVPAAPPAGNPWQQ